MKAVFTTKPGSGYDDIVEERYHFPRTYLTQVERAVGDLIVYYEPRRTEGERAGGRQAYFAVARVIGVEPDRNREGHFYAKLDSYLSFEAAVPFQANDGAYFESLLRRDDGGTSKGAFGRSVRNVPEEEFAAILDAGFAPESKLHHVESTSARFEMDEPSAPFIRPLTELVVTKPFRERAFTHGIQQAYDRTCAVTGLRIINGGGRPEVQAAHIQPVADNGPDSIRNGMALSGTVHWMFDRGLISVSDDYRLLTVDSGIPDAMRRLMHPSGRLQIPADPVARPLPHYLDYHRRHVFKGTLP